VCVCWLASLLLLGWALPSILGSRLAWPRVLAYLASDVDGQVSSNGASLGWFSPVVVRGIRWEDRRGQALAQIEELRTESTLLSLLFDSRELGVVVLDKPALTVVWRDDGSNLEDALSAWLAKTSSSGAVHGSFELRGGSVDVVDVSQSRIARLESLNAKIQLPATTGSQGVVALDPCRLTIGPQAGDCAARVAWQGEGAQRTWTLSAQVHGMGLSFLQAVARRFGEDVRVDGVLTADVTGEWNGRQGQVSLDVRHANAEPLYVTAPAWLGDDQLRLELLRIAGSCVVADGRWQFRKAQVECDAGQFTIDGQFKWQPSGGSSAWRELLGSAAAADLQLDGRLDLARLARTLPNTLRIREGAAIEAGEVQVRLRGRQDTDARRWTASLATSELAAVREGRRFTWNDPLQVTFEAAQTGDGWQVQQLDCHSSFLRLVGQGTPQAGSVEWTCDLNRLVTELHELFDLGDWQAAGTLESQLHWARNDDGRVALEGTGGIDGLEVTTQRGLTWREARVQTTLSLEADTDGQKLTSIRAGRFELFAGNDRLDLQLLEPVAPPILDGVWAVGVALRGQSASWLARVRPLLSVSPVESAGPVQLECTARVSPQTWDIEHLILRAEPFRFRCGTLTVDERAVHVELAGRWDRTLRQASLASALFQSSAAAFRVTDAAVRLGSARPDLTGEISFRADLERLFSAWQVVDQARNWRAIGAAQGQLSLVQHEGSTRARWSVDLSGAELSRRTPGAAPATANVIPAANAGTWQTVWQEPSLKLVGSGQYDALRETVQLDRCELTSSDQFTLSTEGRIAQLFSRCEVDLKGRASYDLTKLLERLVPGTPVRMSGQDTQEFWLRGPLFQPTMVPVQPAGLATTPRGLLPPELSGLGGLRWQSADVLGIPIGPGLLSVRLEAGTLETGAVEMPVSQGTLRVVPHVYLNNDPPLLTVDPGQVLTDVNITPGMCQGWLKYVTPLAADATRAEGQFSLQLERAAIPLQQPAAAQIQGVMLVDSARVGPGPLALEIIHLGQQIKALLERRLPSGTTQDSITWVTIPRQNTRFRLVNGRLAHDQFEFLIDNTAVRTSGSVGLDQSLELVAQVTIQDAWVAGDPRLAWLKGTTVSIPIGGTLTRPKLDSRALEKLSAQVLQQTANRLLEEGVTRGLQQLLGPK
jgi:hypothetical protein